MSRFIKLAALGALVVAVCAVAAGSASAAAIPTRYIVEGTELTSAETVDGAVGVAQLNSVVSGQKIMIECTANEMVSTGNNSIEGEGKSHTEINYKQCYLYTISKGKRELSTTCRVSEPINFAAVNLLILGPGGLLEDEFKHEFGTANNLFVKVIIEKIPGKTCLLEGEFKVEGSYVASLGDEGEREMSEHELVFISTGSKVKFGTEPASYTNTVSRLKLRSGKSFYAG